MEYVSIVGVRKSSNPKTRDQTHEQENGNHEFSCLRYTNEGIFDCRIDCTIADFTERDELQFKSTIGNRQSQIPAIGNLQSAIANRQRGK